MGISAYKEVTEWNNDEFIVPNHIYLFDGKSNILAYAKESSDEVTIFKKPMPMDTRRRKFEKVKHKALDALAKTLFVEKEVVSENMMGLDFLRMMCETKTAMYVVRNTEDFGKNEMEFKKGEW